ncbi:MAG: hypothetical protein LBU80_02875 [Rikenellaceae bacterium]|jgi:hypothetical protein|nr:hypothetical protein [Rikenellaceae bacterium]
MKTRIYLLLPVLLLLSVVITSCKSDSEKEVIHATGTIIGCYSNGFGSLLLQVDEKYPIGKDTEYIAPGACITWLGVGTYTNMIQVQANLDLFLSEIEKKNIFLLQAIPSRAR